MIIIYAVYSKTPVYSVQTQHILALNDNKNNSVQMNKQLQVPVCVYILHKY